ncbi:MAG: oligoendopeptidase F, partial [Thaumarchaeota archaeon]|nr:oligoendopeptidase F [Nitrososphaerota archaeon]
MQILKPGKWNLSELVADPYSAAFKNKLQEIESRVKEFEKNKKNLVPSISEKKFMEMLHSLEEISEKFGIVSSYASLEYSSDTQSDKITSLLTK